MSDPLKAAIVAGVVAVLSLLVQVVGAIMIAKINATMVKVHTAVNTNFSHLTEQLDEALKRNRELTRDAAVEDAAIAESPPAAAAPDIPHL